MNKDLSWLKELPGRPLIIAEIKHCSPYGYKNPLSSNDQLEICEKVGDIISVHTNELWGGSFDWLRAVCKIATKPVLAKGFHNTIHDVRRARDCGATAVLTVGWHPGDGTAFGPHCWHEVENLSQLLNTEASWVVWNARDPRTGERRQDNHKVAGYQAYEMGYAREFRPTGRICQASMIRGPEDVHPSANAILIGEGLYS